VAKKSSSKRVAQPSKPPMMLIGAAVVAIIVVIAAIWAFSASGAQPASAYPAEINASEVVAKRNAGAFILDVRQPDEWADYHVPGSTLIPLDQLEARVREVPKDREIVVVCRSGNRSATGRDILKKAGYTQVTSLAGGLSQWKAAGNPTVSGP